MKNLKVLVQAMIALILSAVLICCTTSPVKENDIVLVFPDFPDPITADGAPIVSYNEGDVTMPLWYWEAITRYVLRVEETRSVYNAQKE